MANTGYILPQSASSTSETGWADSAGAWINPQNIYGAGEASITDNNFDLNDASHVLRAYNFNFSAIPTGSTINGVVCRIYARSSSTSSRIGLVQLLDTSGARVGTNMAATPTNVTTSSAPYTWGDSTNQWGNSLTEAWVKDADFGVGVGMLNGANNADCYIDSVELDIYYTQNSFSGTPGLGELTLTGYAPTVFASDYKEASPGLAELTLVGYEPTVSVEAVTLLSSLLVYLPFDETSGSTFYDAVGSNDGTGYQSATANADGRVSRAVDMAATNSYVRILANASLVTTGQSFAVQCWFKMDALPSTEARLAYLFSLHSSEGTEAINAYIHNTANSLVIAVENSTGSYFYPTLQGANWSPQIDTWYHLVINQFDDGTHDIWINGVNKTISENTLTGTLRNPDGYWQIGAAWSTDTNALNGQMDEFGFWNRSLSDVEIGLLYNSGNGLAHPFYPKNMTPGLGELTLEGFAPTVAVTQNVTVLPGLGELTFEGYAPTVEAQADVIADPVESLAYSLTGAPWLRYPAKGGLSTDGLNYSLIGSPWWAKMRPSGWTTKSLKAYIGGAWTAKPLKKYISGAWTEKSTKQFNS